MTDVKQLQAIWQLEDRSTRTALAVVQCVGRVEERIFRIAAVEESKSAPPHLCVKCGDLVPAEGPYVCWKCEPQHDPLRLAADNARLRALIKSQLLVQHAFEDAGSALTCACCSNFYLPDAARVAAFSPDAPAAIAKPHTADCPAFTESGEVK